MTRKTAPATEPKKPAPDWERIELDYRSGMKTLRQIADENGISHVAINKRAKRDGWTRDLSAKIQAKAEELVTKASVTKQVTEAQKVTERELIDANAAAIVSIKLAHRKDIGRSRGIVMSMLAEMEAQCGPENAELLEQLGDLMRNPNENGQDKLNDLYRAVASLPGRAKTMKDLASSLAVLIDKEREAFNISAKPGAGGDDAADRSGKTLTDAERVVRLSRLLGTNPVLAGALLKKASSNE